MSVQGTGNGGVKGVLEVQSRLKRIQDQIAARVEVALVRGAARIVQDSDKEVPVDTGDLRRSRFVRKEGSGLSTKITIGYNTPYAIYVHEDLTKNHGEFFNAVYRKDIRAGRTHKRRKTEKAKFLEDPIRNNIDSIREDVAKAVRVSA